MSILMLSTQRILNELDVTSLMRYVASFIPAFIIPAMTTGFL